MTEKMIKVLIAEDDDVSRQLLVTLLKKWGYDVISTSNGDEAWAALQEITEPTIAILDWMMPGMTGVEICQRAHSLDSVYFILLTARAHENDITTGLESGADDYITKPFAALDLRSRMRVGERVLGLQSNLATKIREFSETSEQNPDKKPLVSVCSYCKRIRDEENRWQKLETYMSALLEGRVTHGICPECYEKTIKDWKSQK